MDSDTMRNGCYNCIGIMGSVNILDTIGIYLKDGHGFDKIFETNNMAQFRLKIDELITNGTRADDIIISDGSDLTARMMESVQDDY